MMHPSLPCFVTHPSDGEAESHQCPDRSVSLFSAAPEERDSVTHRGLLVKLAKHRTHDEGYFNQ